MATESLDEKLREQAYLLLCGLLDEQEAEAFRLRVATDSDVARIFDEARKRMELLRDVASLAGLEALVENAEGSVRTVDSIALESTTRITYESSAEFVDLNAQTDNSAYAQLPATKVALDASKYDRKRRRLRRVQRQTFSLGASDPPPSKRSIRLSFYTSITTRIRGWMQKVRLTSPSNSMMVLILLVLTLTTLLSIYSQKRQLKQYFSGDFRIQIATPRILTRKGGQSIEIVTSDYAGAPRRVPVRLCFTDPRMNDFLLAHTESGNADGKVVYDLPDLSAFPTEALLSVYAGTDDLDAFQTFLSVLDQATNRVDEITEKSLVRARNLLVPRLIDRELTELGRNDNLNDFPTTQSDSNDPNLKTAQGSDKSNNSIEPSEIVAEIRPEIGRLSANFINRMRVFVSSADGEPVAQRFILEETSSGSKLAFSSSPLGVGFFEWTPKENTFYRLSIATDESGEGSEKLGGNLYAPDDIGKTAQYLNGAMRFSFKEPGENDNFVFKVASTEEEVSLGLDSYVVGASNPIRLIVGARRKIPLVAVIEKNGFIIAEQFITAAKENSDLEVPLPNDLSGLFTLSIYRKDETSLSLLGGATFYRLCEADFLRLDVGAKFEKEGGDDSASPEVCNALEISATKPYLDRSRLQKASSNELPMTLEIFWSPDVETAIRSLDLEDLFSSIDEEIAESALATSCYRATSPPPVIFDNLTTLKEHTREKMEHFQAYQTRTSRWVLRFGYFGCCALVLLSFFFILFEYFSVLKGSVFIVTTVVLAFLFVTFQKSVTSSFQISEEIAVSTSANKLPNDSSQAGGDGVGQETNRETQTESQSSRTLEAKRLLSRKIGLGTTTISLTELCSEEERYGYLLVKLVDGGARRWTITRIGATNSQEE